MGVYAGFHSANVDPNRLYVTLLIFRCDLVNIAFIDDSAAHISEETANAARAAPLAILVSVATTSILGWLLLISISFAMPGSVSDILGTALPLPLGQVFLNVIGKHGMLAIWSLIIVVQVGIIFTSFKHHVYPTLVST